MRLLWLSNMAPGPVRQVLTGERDGGLWMDHVLDHLQSCEEIHLRMLCPWEYSKNGTIGNRWSFQTFLKEKPDFLSFEQEKLFRRQLREFQPDVIHIWGTEFAHTLAMVQACRQENLLGRVVISIQGLCHYVARHYTEGLPLPIVTRYTLRDLLRRDNILFQQKTFFRRGENEIAALKQVSHIMGRTQWDRACTRLINPGAEYHFCNETLRKSFYEGSWTYEKSEKHRIFTSSRLYPIKGFHYVLEAFSEILREFPDAVLAVPGEDPVCSGKALLRQDSYARYLKELTERYGLQGHIQYLGSLSETEMKAEFLKANVYVLPSTIENSSNSLGEAMLLGVPAAASDVGGTATILKPGEGILYQSTAPYMLADAVREIFLLKKEAEKMGAAASAHARKTHDPARNFETLMEIYRSIGGGECL